MDTIAAVQPIGLDTPFSQQDSMSPFDGGPSAEEATLGDKFFQALSETKEDISQKTTNISESLRITDISPVELIRLQFEIAQISIQQELISKGVSKSTQNVDTLLKAQ